MRKLPLVTTPVIVCLLAGGCSPPAEEAAPARAAEQVQADVEAVRAQWQELANADDFAGLANTYTEDAYFVDNYGNAYEGRAAIAGYFERSLPVVSGYSIVVDGTVLDGELVASYGTWTGTAMLPTGEAQQAGRWQTVGMYQPDGTLKLRLHLSMVPAVPPAAPPAQ